MANTLGNYVAQLFARQALMYLRAKKGVVRLLNRQIEGERNGSWEQGQVVNIRRPNTFTAAAHVAGTGTTVQDIKAQNVTITLDQHFETKIQATDVERAFTGGKLMQEYIGPIVDSLVEKIESSVYTLMAKIGPTIDISALATAEKIIVDTRRVLMTNRTPMTEGSIFFAVDEYLAALFLKDPIFNQAQIVGGGNDNQNALVNANLGRRFGVDIFESQLAFREPGQFTGTLAAAAAGGDELGAVNGAHDVNVSTLAINALTDGETVKAGQDRFTIAGDPTIYMITADATVAANAISASIYPPLQKPAANAAVVTFINHYTIQDAAAATRENVMFHRDAMALVMAPLPQDGNGAGAEIFVATDPETGLSIRVRRFYDGDTATMRMAVDALWGLQALNVMMAARAVRVKPT